MSFSEQCKLELLQEELPKHGCCRRAMAYGMLFCADTTDGLLRFTVPSREVGERAADMLQAAFHRQAVLSDKTVGSRRDTQLTLLHPKVWDALQRLTISDLPVERVLNFGCEHCMRYFLKGVMIGAGTISKPDVANHLEFCCRDAASAERLSNILAALGTKPRIIRRANGTHVYYKNSGAIEDILSYLDARRTLFAFINAKIEREIRNNENRATNCVTQNIRRSVVAAANQVQLIEQLRRAPLWDKLSRELRETAKLRLENPSAPLNELAALHNPPITKSGLNHRLQRLMQLARGDGEGDVGQ